MIVGDDLLKSILTNLQSKVGSLLLNVLICVCVFLSLYQAVQFYCNWILLLMHHHSYQEKNKVLSEKDTKQGA